MKALLQDLADVVSNAIRSFGGDLGSVVGTGAYGTPTQAIDQIAEEAIFRHLEYEGAELNVLSEEKGFVDRGAPQTLVVDPVDGTYNAVRGLPMYATSLAIGGGSLSTVTHGLVRQIPGGETFYAAKGEGAVRNGRPIRTRPFKEREGLFSVYMGAMAEPESLQVARTARRVRNLGAAALDLCGVASGAFDVYYMRSKAKARLRIVDIAAGVLIVREAGGVVVDEAGTELDLPFTLDARTNLVAAGDAKALEGLP